MELLLALAIIIAVAELKDWKQQKRVSEILSHVDKLSQEIAFNKEAVHQAIAEIKFNKSLTEGTQYKLSAVMEQLEDYRTKIDQVESNTATILKEYELNGIPLGYQRKNPDFIEGL